MAITSGVGVRFLRRAQGDDYAVKNLTSDQARILAAVYVAITGIEASDKAELSRAMGLIDQFLQHLNPRDLKELKLALVVIEHSPLFFHGFLDRFSVLSIEKQMHCLQAHRFGANWRAPLFSGMKELCFLAYYANPTRFAPIGYEGAWVTPGEIVPEYNDEYQKLEAPL